MRLYYSMFFAVGRMPTFCASPRLYIDISLTRYPHIPLGRFTPIRPLRPIFFVISPSNNHCPRQGTRRHQPHLKRGDLTTSDFRTRQSYPLPLVVCPSEFFYPRFVSTESTTIAVVQAIFRLICWLPLICARYPAYFTPPRTIS